jgi:hypothetical protein
LQEAVQMLQTNGACPNHTATKSFGHNYIRTSVSRLSPFGQFNGVKAVLSDSTPRVNVHLQDY